MATAAPKTAMLKSPGSTLQLNSVEEMFRLAEILYKGGASQLPNVGSPSHVFHLILHGMEIGLTPTQSLAGLSMGKNGKPSIMGDAALALVMQSGLLEDIKEFWEGEDDDRKGVCVVKRKGFPDQRRFEFTVAQAKQAGLIKRAQNEKGDGPWIAYRDRMLRYRPLGYALRDVFPDVLKGLYLTEEVADAQEPGVVNTEVKVLGSTADKPREAVTADAHGPGRDGRTSDATPVVPPVTPAAPKAIDGPVTTDQLEELLRLKKLVMASKGVGADKLREKAEWEQVLAPFNVNTAKALTAAQAADLIDKLIKQEDVFTAGPSAQSGSTA
jgi:hypothetical protein